MGEDKIIPVGQAVASNEFLAGAHGILYRQEFQVGEVIAQLIGLPCEKANNYKFGPLPQDKHTLTSQSDPNGWRPRQEEIDGAYYSHLAKEESSCTTNCLLYCLGCVNFRPYTMQYAPMQGGQAQFSVNKNFALGGFCCCPHTIELMSNGQVIGKVVEDVNLGNYCCRYCELACCCTVPYNMQLVENGVLANKYQVIINRFICGPHNNCCAATPCKNDALFDVYKYTGGAVDKSVAAGHIQKTYGNACGTSSCGRNCLGSADQFLVEWPANASPEEKALFVSAITLIDYIFFENSGSE